MNNIPQATYTMTETQKRLKIGYTTLKKLVDKGYLKSIKYPGVARRISERAIQEYITKGEKQ